SRGVRIEWIEFPAGPPLLEALNAGSIDLGHAGDSPPLFAQAAGIPFVYVATSPPSPDASAILVRRDSNLKEPGDLKGRRVGFTKGTSAHTMVLRFLEKNHFTLADITPVYLLPADGRVALETGSIDAWSIWDPYLASAEQGSDVRVFASGSGYVEGREFYFASRRIADSAPERLTEFLNELSRVKTWADNHAEDVNRFLSRETGISLEAIALAESRLIRYDAQPVTDELIASQQSLADRYFELKLLPRRIDVREAVLHLPFEGNP
ncbi:MAG TPA: aliphatic sulfonate ABC transporter substrate-binding protein, partial [Planctomicrobium sp.]|nr:aliphatic sulfonate ABC transporter substrate-binding protein [Planctomicrobium sp.]